jgi:hypothetical protein
MNVLKSQLYGTAITHALLVYIKYSIKTEWNRIHSTIDSGTTLTDTKEQNFAAQWRSEHGLLYLKNSYSRSRAPDQVVLSADSWKKSGIGIGIIVECKH